MAPASRLAPAAAGRAKPLAVIRPGTLLTFLVALSTDAFPPRPWLDRLAWLLPGPTATRWLLLADLVCLVALGLGARSPLLGVPVALGVGFVALNLAGMALTDFYLGLALFHVTLGVIAAVALRRRRWIGIGLVALALLLGILT